MGQSEEMPYMNRQIYIIMASIYIERGGEREQVRKRKPAISIGRYTYDIFIYL